MYRFFAVVVLGFLLYFGGQPQWCQGAQGEERVTLFPFSYEGGGKYRQLKDALRLMIAGRLSGREGITVVESSLGADERSAFLAGYPQGAQQLFDRLQVDYVAAGSLAAAGQALDLRLTFYGREGGEPIAVAARAESEKEVMAAVDELLEGIAVKVFGAAGGGAETPIAETRQKGMEAFQTKHPDRQYKEEIISGAGIFAEDAEIMFSREDMRRRRVRLADAVIALAAADIDGDGSGELVTASAERLRVYHYNRGLLEQIGEYETGAAIHAMSVGDLDGDGVLEICLSGVEDDRFKSEIVAWSEAGGFRLLQGDIGYAVRALKIPGQGVRLIGQAKSLEVESFLKNGLFTLTFDPARGTVEVGEELFLPKAFTLFDFTYADIDGDGSFEKVRIADNLNMEVYNSDNRLIWVSEASYGGSDLYLGSRWLKNESPLLTGDSGQEGEYYHALDYIPVLPLAADIDLDGKQEILTAKNTLSTFKALRNLRKFSDGRVVCMGWNGVEMQELWATEMLTGSLAAIAFTAPVAPSPAADQAKQAAERQRAVRMYVSQVLGKDLVDILSFARQHSNLIIYDLKILQESPETPEMKQ